MENKIDASNITPLTPPLVAFALSLHKRFWYLSFPGIWYATYALKRRRKRQNWTDVQYYRAMFSMVSLKPQNEGDKFASLRERLMAAITQDLASARILDLATGCGYQARDVWRHGYRKVFACDLVEGRIDLARQHNNDTGIRFLVSGMERICFPTGFFDAITISAALHDLPAAAVQDVLRECNRVLRPGGQLLMLDDAEPRAGQCAPQEWHAGILLPVTAARRAGATGRCPTRPRSRRTP